MIRQICRLAFRITGWKTDEVMPGALKKCIIVAAPHTSNWDFWYCMAAFAILKLRIRFTVKKEWMRFPFHMLMKPLGAIAIDRTPRGPKNERPSFVDAMIQLFNSNEELIIVITPEGTRSKNDVWKTGFYHIAKEANVPILLGYTDYKKKTTGVSKPLYATDYEKDMKTIMDFYAGITPKYPEKFSVHKDYKSA